MEWCRRAGVHRGGQRFIRAVDGRVQAEETDHEKLVSEESSFRQGED
jgi:hypothetical protein